MKWIVFLASVVTALCAFSTAPVIADDVSDVVRARANARAGGGTSGHDAYVLKNSGGALSGTKAKKQAAKKYRARQAAKKKAAAKKRRAAIAAKKRRAAIAAKKKKAAQQRAIASRKAKLKQKRAAAHRAEAKKNAQAKSDDKTEDAVSAPSTAAVLTNQDVADDRVDTPANDNAPNVVAANDNEKASDSDANVETPEVNNSAVTESGTNGKCKRYIPEVGKTVSVDC